MNETSYDVRVWKLKPRLSANGKVTSYGVRWSVAGNAFYDSYKNRAQAESYRAELVSAARKGEAFVVESGLPVSMDRKRSDISWYAFACTYVDMKWGKAAATYRRTIAESLTAVTPAMFSSLRGKPHDKVIRSALERWAFNKSYRESPNKPEDVVQALNWVARNSKPLSAVLNTQTVRAMLESLSTKLDGSPAAASVARQKRMILSNSLNYAVERGYLPRNPVPDVKWTAPKSSRAIDRRCVPNPVQARTLLDAVRQVKNSGPRLVAFFAVMYFAALRPEEVVDLRESNLFLPSKGWGEIFVEEASPHAGKKWTDSGTARDQRQLKHRAKGEGRRVPCPPELVERLCTHLETFKPGSQGRVFYGEKGGQIPLITYTRVWRAARKAVFTQEAHESLLARRPYDLRHAAVSTWLNGGVAPTTVAKWAGHSVAVLLQVYASCLDGADKIAQQQVEEALGTRTSG